MLKLKKIISKFPHTDQGFTMFEVLVSVLVASAFVTISMEALVIATMFRVKAQEKEIASQLIQQDVEAVKFAAHNFDETTDPNDPNFDPNSLSFNVDAKCSAPSYDQGYAKEVYDNLPPEPNDVKLLVNAGKEFRLERLPQTAISTAPHKVLRIKYRVSELKNGQFVYTNETDRDKKAVAKDYIEVIPNVALQCP